MANIDEKISICLSSVIGAISLVDFKTILDIILIIISILNITIVIIIKVWRYLGDKQLDDNEKADLLEDFDTLKDNIKSLNNNAKGMQENGRQRQREERE